ncbi:MAG: LytR family transcriptional regulator, partial [Exiguobacterium sp.]|nr:LytR family transcriptional regulator [Exiguobacterium sp.]
SQLQPYAKSLKSFNRETLEGNDLTLNGVYYYELDPVDLRDAQALLQTELGMPVTADEPSTDETDDSMTETTTY